MNALAAIGGMFFGAGTMGAIFVFSLEGTGCAEEVTRVISVAGLTCYGVFVGLQLRSLMPQGKT